MHLHILIPHLSKAATYLHENKTPLDLPALDTLLSHSSRQNHTLDTGQDSVLQLFGLPKDTALAPITAMVDLPAQRDKIWMRADPVHLRLDHQSLRLFDASVFELSQAEADALVESINSTYADEAWQILAPSPSHWYLALDHDPDLITSPLSQVRGDVVQNHLPQGQDATIWNQRFNEIQMLLHNHPVNKTREAEEKPTINSLWFWGQGSLTTLPDQPWTHVWSDDALSRGLATACDIKARALPLSVLDCVEEGAANAQHLCIFNQLDDPEGLEMRWWLPILENLRQGRIQQVTVYAGNGKKYVMRPWHRWRIWRRQVSWIKILS